jgi:Mn-dependent DtxR family transcriptional regulator
MSGKLKFQNQMGVLETEMGKEYAERAYLIYAKVTEWLIRHGHGSTEIHAKGHKFDSKIHFRTIGDLDD